MASCVFFSLCLFQTQGVKSHVNHPCYPKQYNMSIKLGKDVFDSPCTQSYRPPQFDPQMSVTVVGTGDYDNCQSNVKKIFSFDQCKFSKCSFDGVFQPDVRGSFMVRKPFRHRHRDTPYKESSIYLSIHLSIRPSVHPVRTVRQLEPGSSDTGLNTGYILNRCTLNKSEFQEFRVTN